MINEDNWENSTNRNMRFFYDRPKNRKCQPINFDEYPK